MLSFCTIIHSFVCQFFTTIDTAIMQSPGRVLQRCILANFAKSTRIYLVFKNLVFNEVADLESLTLSKKKFPHIFFLQILQNCSYTFLRSLSDSSFYIKTHSAYCPITIFCLFKNNVTFVFRLSTFST